MFWEKNVSRLNVYADEGLLKIQRKIEQGPKKHVCIWTTNILVKWGNKQIIYTLTHFSNNFYVEIKPITNATRNIKSVYIKVK